MVYADDDKTQKAIDIIKANARSRMQLSPLPHYDNYGCTMHTAKLPVGGATIMVIDIECFEKI